MKKKLKYDLHTHTCYSDGDLDILGNVKVLGPEPEKKQKGKKSKSAVQGDACATFIYCLKDYISLRGQ